MSEDELSEQELIAFKENFSLGLDDLLGLVEEFPEPLPPDPSSMGFDERTFEELTEKEKEAAQQVIYQKLGLDPQKLDESKLREYVTGEINASVYKTNKEGTFLQELYFKDGETRFVLGPDSDI